MSTKTKDVRAVLVEGGRKEAGAEGSVAVEAEHLLLALTKLPGSTAARLLAEAGLDHDGLRAALDREWEQGLATAGVSVRVAELPSATPAPDRSSQFAASAKQALVRAMEHAASTGGGRIGAANMLVGLLDDRLGRVARALDAAGVDRAALRARAHEAAGRGDH
jgi:ATP-dependent Clp protease ATP-binding subunit ClpA